MQNKNIGRRKQRWETKNKVGEEQGFNKYLLFPLIFSLGIIPFISRLKDYNTNMSQFSWFPAGDLFSDIFLYYKQGAMIALSAVIAFMIGYKLYKDRKAISFSPILIPLAVYMALVLLSAVFSDYASFSFKGSFEQFESVLAYLGYGLLVYYAYLFINSEKDIHYIIKFLLISVLIMSLLGLMQYLGRDFFTSSLGKNFILPQEYRNTELTRELQSNRVYLSLYNPNYVGSYVALMLPIMLILMFFQKKPYQIALYLAAVIGLIIAAVGSQSLTGIIALGAAFVCIFIFMWRYLIKRYYIVIPAILVLVMAVFILNKQTNGLMLNRISNIFEFSKEEYALSALETKEDHIALVYNNSEMKIQYLIEDNAAVLIVTDENNNFISYIYDESTNSYLLTDERFTGISIIPDFEQYGVFGVRLDGKVWRFSKNTESSTYRYINVFGKQDQMIMAPSAVFNKYGAFASGRGYLWSRTIPMLKDYIILGSGPDTFAMVFPQQDYMSIHRYGFEGSIITKPHNMYLQIAIQSGLLSLIAFLAFYLMYFIQCIRLYIRGRFTNYLSQVGLAIFISSIAYMVTGIANDSSITTAPVFWTLIGLGIVINLKIRALAVEKI